jgi:DNA processing protein
VLGVSASGPTGRSVEQAGAVPGDAPRPLPVSERDAWAVLTSVSGLGPVGFGALLRHYGRGTAILEAALRPRGVVELIAAGINDERTTFGTDVAREIVKAAREPRKVLNKIEAAGVSILTLDDDEYPNRLRSIEMPPHVLFVAGDVAGLNSNHAVAVVGTRRATEGGRMISARIGAAIAKTGAVVISGLAVGIDGAAHAAVNAEGGRTVAVLGSGHGRLYPQAHVGLARSIIEHGGALISELPPDMAPTAGTFPRRNRLISGLADATIVVEAGERSGALITAAWALEQGRECFLVPGSIDAPRSAGCLQWLRNYTDQVRIVAGISELIEDLGLLAEEPTARRAGRLSIEAELIELGTTARSLAIELVRGRGTLDELVAATGQPVATALGALTLLELRGLATSAYGRYRPAGRLAGLAPP